MAATQESDFTNIVDTSDAGAALKYVADQYPLVARALHGLACFFVHKVSTGTEPADILEGVILGEGANHNKWRVIVVANDLYVQENTGTEGVPVWTTRLTCDITTGLTCGSIGSGTFADARIAESNVTQHEAAIDHDALSNFAADEHLDWTGDCGTKDIHANNIPEGAVTQHVAAIDHDSLLNFAADEHLDWTGDCGTKNIHLNNIPQGAASGLDADTVDGVEAAAMGQLAVAAEWTKAQCSTESEPASASNAITIDLEASNYFEITLTENITSITFSNATKPGTRVIKWIQDTTGAYTVTGYPAAVKWIGDTEPVISAGADAVDIMSIVVDKGGNIYGVIAQNFS
jgi:hypothetical protein